VSGHHSQFFIFNFQLIFLSLIPNLKKSIMKLFTRVLSIVALAAALLVVPAAGQSMVQVDVAPQHADWTYTSGENLSFDVNVIRLNVPMDGVELNYEIAEEQMPAFKKGTIKVKDGKARIEAGKFTKPVFVRCRVWFKYDGYDYSGTATAGYDPEKIQPTTTDPADFDKFWSDNKAALARVAMNPILTLMPERCTSRSDVYHVSIQNIDNSRVYGILAMPKKPGKYPAILNVPGAGIRPYGGDINTADGGFVTLEIGIHGVPVNMPSQVYNDLASGALNNYMSSKLDDKNAYYYRRVYLGCVRAVDFLTSLEQWDGTNMFVRGGSQGGALSIVTAALDSRITALVAYYPALCDLTGYLFGRAGGWPHMFRGDSPTNTKARIETTYYYDVVNFARRVDATGFYAFGYNDLTCPPTSMFSAYNVITAPKQLFLAPPTGHNQIHEETDRAWKWLRAQVK
jgi:cephalosporin-C deacetylase-like acetyl esterase